jgi:hypothetical protein
MQIEVHRQHPSDYCVVGQFVLDSGQQWFSLELPLLFEGQENVPDKCCVLAGEYDVENLYSEHFAKMMPHVVGVPGRTAIEIHPASRPKDLLGCVAPAANWYTQNPTSVEDVVVNGSQEAFGVFDSLFMSALSNNESVKISFTNEF